MTRLAVAVVTGYGVQVNVKPCRDGWTIRITHPEPSRIERVESCLVPHRVSCRAVVARSGGWGGVGGPVGLSGSTLMGGLGTRQPDGVQPSPGRVAVRGGAVVVDWVGDLDRAVMGT
ncbi:hypothetical protein GCM10009677_55560 [Sphaerisporangium rubeum]